MDMEFENGADEELYRMTPQQKAGIIKKVEEWIQDQERVGVADGVAYPLQYLSPEDKPTDKEFQLYHAIKTPPQMRVAQQRKSTAEAKNEAQATFTNLMKAPLHPSAKNHAMSFLPEGYGALAMQMQQSKPKFGEKKGGKSKKRRNKRKSNKRK